MTTRRPRRIPPVLLTAVFGVLMWLVSTLTPSVDIPLPARAIVAVSLAAAGLAVTTLAVKGFREQRTSVNPLDLSRTSAVVTTGIYRLSRNPMYLAMLLGLLALGCLLSNPVSMGIAVLFVPAITRLQIIPEERALSRRFGTAYATYCTTVRRWI
jgi:protein-S-isoprenylcysteine O-methyltransferase Ste14